MSERFDKEWFWVFCSGVAAVVVVAANLLLLVSICRKGIALRSGGPLMAIRYFCKNSSLKLRDPKAVSDIHRNL